MKAGGPNEVKIDRQMIVDARSASNKYKMALEEKTKKQDEQEKRLSTKRKLEAEARNVRRQISRSTAENNVAISASKARLREIEEQIVKFS